MAGVKNAQGGFQLDSDVHITFEDQQKINKFARLNAKMEEYKEELKAKERDIVKLEDAYEELELTDDVKLPYQFGEVFITQDLEKCQNYAEDAKKKKKEEIASFKSECAHLIDMLEELKEELYEKFGNHINLEAEED